MAALNVSQLREKLFGPRTGIIGHLAALPKVADGPDIFTYGCEVALTAQAIEGRILNCGGCGLTEETALLRCLGEAIERYCASQNIHATKVEKAKELTTDTVELSDLTPFSSWQYSLPDFPFQEPTEETPLRWELLHSLSQKKTKAIPAAFVYLNHRPTEGEALLAPATSTGIACHENKMKAALAALLEIVERDAFTTTWIARKKARRIEWPINERLLPYGAKAQLFDISLDCKIPVALCLLRGHSAAGPTTVIGTSAALTWQESAEKASREAAMAWGYAVYLCRQNSSKNWGENFENVRDFSDHARLYTGDEKLAQRAFAFLEDSPKGEAPDYEFTEGSDERRLQWALDKLAEIDVEVLVRDLTTSDITTLGLSVVRVVCPGMVLLHGDHRLPFLGFQRLFRYTDSNSLNPYPHPSG